MSTVSSQEDRLSIDYVGTMRPLFWLVIKTTVLTVLTIGIYRFWMKARLRRYYWSGIRPDDTPLEYTGTGLEKLLGFFIAVVFLAVYLGIFQVLLSFIGLAYLSGNQQTASISLYLSTLAAIPLVYFAQYRARRYILSRTRWRGVRFGMEAAGVKYAFYAIGQSVITLLSLGLLYPRQSFNLEKYRTDRTWFGSINLRQGGRWQMIFRPWITVYGALAMGLGLAFLGYQYQQMIFLILGFLVFYLGGAAAYVFYAVSAFGVMASHKMAGEGMRFTSKVRVSTILRIYALGGIAITCTIALLFIILAMAIQQDIRLNLNVMQALLNPATAITYLIFLLAFGALLQVFITQPMLAHYMTTLTLDEATELERVKQRPEDANVEAEGLADALDVGAAI